MTAAVNRRRNAMTTRADEERRREEMGRDFLKELRGLFDTSQSQLEQKFVPRPEVEARMDHQDTLIEKLGISVEKLVGGVQMREDARRDLTELRVEIEKLKTAREADMQRGYGYRIDDMQGRYRGDERVERG